MKKVILYTFMYAPIGLLVGPILTGSSFEFALSTMLQNQGTLGLLLICPVAWIYYLSSRSKQKTLPQTSSDTDAKVYTRDDNSANIEIDKLKQQVNALERKLVGKEKENDGKGFFGFIGKILSYFIYVTLSVVVVAVLFAIFET